MNVKINIVELASELADLELAKHFEYSSICVWQEDDNECLVYTEEAQEIFNDLYDKFYSLIDRLKVD